MISTPARKLAALAVSALLGFTGFWPGGLQAAEAYQKVKASSLFNGEVVTEYKLGNGFRVLLLPRHQAKVLTYQVWFGVGSTDEKMDPRLKKTGLAHLFEHMMFRGTEKHPDGKFDELTSRMGAEKQNATTSYYRTNYFQSVPSSKLEALMELEADRMQNLKLSADLLEKEKGAVVGELRRLLDNPNFAAYEALTQNLFEVSPFHWTVIGTEEEIRGFTMDEAQYFYRTNYAPNNATLIVIGDTEESELMPLVVKYYGKMTAQDIPRPPHPAEPPRKKEKRVRVPHTQATSETLMIGYPIAAVDSPDMPALSLIGSHLSTGMESRFRKAIVDKNIAVNASAGPNSKPDMFEIFIQLAEKRSAEEALKIVDRELALLRNTPVPKEAFERARNQDLLQAYGGIGNDSSLANLLGEYLTLGGNYLRGFEILEESKKVTAKDLQAVAKKYFNNNSRVVVTVFPSTAKGKERL